MKIQKSEIEEFKGSLPSDFVVQQINPFTVCVLQKRYVGKFCFDWGQATKCFATTIDVQRGESITGSLSVTVNGVGVGHSITQTLQTSIKEGLMNAFGCAETAA